MEKCCFYNKKKYYLCIAFNKRHSLFAICLAELAQLVEQRIRNAWVGGSSPPFGSNEGGVPMAHFFVLFIHNLSSGNLNNPSIEKIILGVDPGTNVMGYGVLKVKGNKAELMAMGVIELKKYASHYLRLGKIFERITSIIDSYKPDEMAIEAPFYGKNVQSMLKLGRAQGVAITAAIMRDIPITEYEPRKIKMAITGNGSSSKEQVAGMLQRMLHISKEDMDVQLDATDALGAAYCHFIQMGKPEVEHKFKSWKDFVSKNADKVVTHEKKI